eukprot:15457921-Alexandrium_andersonii.AAC.1
MCIRDSSCAALTSARGAPGWRCTHQCLSSTSKPQHSSGLPECLRGETHGTALSSARGAPARRAQHLSALVRGTPQCPRSA